MLIAPTMNDEVKPRTSLLMTSSSRWRNPHQMWMTIKSMVQIGQANGDDRSDEGAGELVGAALPMSAPVASSIRSGIKFAIFVASALPAQAATRSEREGWHVGAQAWRRRNGGLPFVQYPFIVY